jgi:hypothetical protein
MSKDKIKIKKKQWKEKNIILVNSIMWGGKNPTSFSFFFINLILTDKIRKEKLIKKKNLSQLV